MHKLIGYPFDILVSMTKPVLAYHNLNIIRYPRIMSILGYLMISKRLMWPLLVPAIGTRICRYAVG